LSRSFRKDCLFDFGWVSDQAMDDRKRRAREAIIDEQKFFGFAG
jgi:hypothetical protein